MELSKFLSILLLVIVLSMTAVIAFFPPNGDFRDENPFWNGLSTFNSELKATSLDSLSDLPSDPNGTSLVVVPYVEFNEPDLESLKNYVSLGGTLVVLDDYGYGNQILNHLSLNVRFTGDPLSDPLFDYRSKWLPKISDFAATPIAHNVSSVVFNHASVLNSTSEVDVLAYSSRFSFVDLNDNSVLDANEAAGPLPVAALVNVGDGYVLVVSDPSMIINGMIGMDDNLRFVQNAVEFQGSGSRVLVDQSHLPTTPLDGAKAVIASVYGAVSSPWGTLSFIAVILALSLKPMWRKGGKIGGQN